MNKQKFVDYLRSPESINSEQFDELQQLIADHPYFSVAKSVAARVAKELDDDQKGQLIASAAIFATDRKHLKKYVNGEVAVTKSEAPIEAAPPAVEEPKKEEPKTSRTSSNSCTYA